MKRSILIIALATAALWSCNGPQPRRPVSVKTGSFMKASIERNKKILEAEEQQILAIIEADTLKEYQRSANGYWYYFDKRDTTATQRPEEGDMVRISYELRHLNNDMIYTKEEVGDVEFKVDKEALFPGMRTAVKLLNEGETATFFFPSALGYGYHGDENKIGTNTPLIASVTLEEIIEKSHDSIPSKRVNPN